MAEALEYVIRVRGGGEGAAEIRKVDEAAGRGSRSIKQMGDEGGRAARNLNPLAGGVRSVGKALIAAGAGFVAWEAGKKAFSFTEELVKSTKQLTAVTGMSTAESSRWAGVTAAVGGNAAQSSMAFQKIANATEKQILATHKQIAAGKLSNATVIAGHEPLEKLGLSTAFLEKHQKNLGPVMEAIVDRFDKMGNTAARSSVLTQLFGRNWKQLSPLLLEGKAHLDGLLSTAKEMGVELKGNAGQSLEELREKQIRASLATEALRLRFTEIAAKPMGDLLQGFSALTLAITKNEWGKFDKQAVQIGKTFSKIAETILPHVAESFAHMAPIVLKAFAHGFATASLGGEAIIAFTIANKLGLTGGIFQGIGRNMGKSVAKGVAAESGAAAVVGKSWGLVMGGALIAAVVLLAKTNLGNEVLEALGLRKHHESPLEEAIKSPGVISPEYLLTMSPHERGELQKIARVDTERHYPGEVFWSEGHLRAQAKKEGTTAAKAMQRVEGQYNRGTKANPEADGGFQRRHPAHAHGAMVRDIHVHVDGRKLFTINARQALQAEGAGE